MVVIGVTGGVGTGKSTVARMFQKLGATVLDADAIAHELIEPKRIAWRKIVKTFGEGILNEDETVNRKKLAALVFENEQDRQHLERIVHPGVMREMKQRLHRLKRSRRVRAVVFDIPLLFEAGAQDWVDARVVVVTTPEIQRERLQRNRGWSNKETEDRVHAQWNLSAKVELADYVVDNSDGVGSTRTQVKRIWDQLAQRPTPRSSRRLNST